MTNATQQRPSMKVQDGEKRHRWKRDSTPVAYEALQIVRRIKQEKAQ
ncbi:MULTISPECIES: hypothetical protein [Corynebacterium]|nr:MULTISPECIES: hypothetical protein [Corynebacterium]QJS16617.1 hypothetical protein HK412_10240 [Corynebacterium glutamicum]QXU45144.1 hypothetical protein KW808_12200 [[Brevibacterium] flavum]